MNQTIQLLRHGKRTDVVWIYKIQSQSTGAFYIGSCVCFKRRYAVHLSRLQSGENKHPKLFNHAKKHNLDDLVFSIVEICSFEMLLIREQHHLDSLEPSLNVLKIANSWLGLKHSPESIAKMRLRVVSEETRRKISHTKTGKKHFTSEATRRSISDAKKGRKSKGHGNQKLTQSDLNALSEGFKEGTPVKPLAEKFGVTQRTIYTYKTIWKRGGELKSTLT